VRIPWLSSRLMSHLGRLCGLACVEVGDASVCTVVGMPDRAYPIPRMRRWGPRGSMGAGGHGVSVDSVEGPRGAARSLLVRHVAAIP
jgi:hypothetical protein